MQPTHSSRRILLPANFSFILLSLLAALVLDLIPIGRIAGIPDWLALVLAFWSVREPLKIGMTSGFVLGLVMDVAQGAVMGQHALAYVLLTFLASSLSRRILWFPLSQQALHLLPLFLVTQAVMVVARMLGGADFPGWTYFLSSFIAALLWPPLNYALLLPQFRPAEKDENRPI
jgi:rod shape-determining protein MreD